jgi:glycosyltransferase involved in cell wall biosynthesis
MKETILSVIVPTYNHENFIETCLKNIISQKVDFNFEIIIGNDCSTDLTCEKIKKISSLNQPNINLKLITQTKNLSSYPNKPGRLNFIECLKHANGKYIAICEGDDYWCNNDKLKIQIDFLEKNTDYSLTFTNSYRQNIDGSLEIMYDNFNEKEDILSNNFIPTNTAVFVNKSILKVSLDTKNNIIGDWPLWIELSMKGKFKYFNVITGVRRLHDKGVWQNGWTDKIGSKRLLNEIDILDYFLKKKPVELKKIQSSIIDRLIRVFEFNYDSKSYYYNLSSRHLIFCLKSFKLFKIYFHSFCMYIFSKVRR